MGITKGIRDCWWPDGILEGQLWETDMHALGFRIQGLGFRFQGLGFRLQSLRFRSHMVTTIDWQIM